MKSQRACRTSRGGNGSKTAQGGWGRTATTKGGGLDAEFSDWFDGYVGQMLDIHRMAQPAPRTADVWGCKNVGDFMCGFFVGEMIGAAVSALQSRHGREPTAEEHAEIASIVERRSDSIRDAFLRFN